MREQMCPVVSLLGRVFRLDCQVVVTSDSLPYRKSIGYVANGKIGGSGARRNEGIVDPQGIIDSTLRIFSVLIGNILRRTKRIVCYAWTILQSDERDTSANLFCNSRLTSKIEKSNRKGEGLLAISVLQLSPVLSYYSLLRC